MPEGRQDDRAPGDPEYEGTVEYLRRENKHLILETEYNSLIDCTVQSLNMYNKDLQNRIKERVVKKEEEKENNNNKKKKTKKKRMLIVIKVQPAEPKVPPPEKVSMEIQTDEPFLSEQHGSSSKEEVPATSGGSQKGEEPEEKKADLQTDDIR